jgi:hypothetical protein
MEKWRLYLVGTRKAIAKMVSEVQRMIVEASNVGR